MTNDIKRGNFPLRMPKELARKVAEAAKSMGVSRNAYIVMVLTKILEEGE